MTITLAWVIAALAALQKRRAARLQAPIRQNSLLFPGSREFSKIQTVILFYQRFRIGCREFYVAAVSRNSCMSVSVKSDYRLIYTTQIWRI
jgi:hypothetical protein